MKLNNKGFAISSIMYIILVFSLVLVVSILGLLSSRKMTLDKVKKTTLNEVKSRLNQRPYYVGDIVTVKGEEYRVLADSPKRQDYVVLLKVEPLSFEEIESNRIGSDGLDHVNRYNYLDPGRLIRLDGASFNPALYGAISYYSSATCGYPTPESNYYNGTGCESEHSTSYNTSDIKYVLDSWTNSKFVNDELKMVDGYKSRLIKLEDLLPYSISCTAPVIENYGGCQAKIETPSWLLSKYWYWTMTPGSYSSRVLIVSETGNIYQQNTIYIYVSNGYGAIIRPVINIYKSAIE